MTEKPMRRTQARVQERQRRRAEQERKERLKWQIPLGVLGLVVVFAAAYFVFTTVAKPKAGNAGGIGPRVQVDTDKLDLGKQLLGKTVHASFDLKNAGDEALTLNAAQIATVLEGC